MLHQANEALIEACMQGRQMAIDIRVQETNARQEAMQFAAAHNVQEENVFAGNQVRCLQQAKGLREAAGELGKTVLEAFGDEPVKIVLTEAGQLQKGVVKERLRHFRTGRMYTNDPVIRARNPRGILQTVDILGGNVEVEAFRSQHAGRNGGHFLARVLNVQGEPLIRLEPYKLRLPRLFI
jgi:hypothetical protein